jgi:NhaP-type Na+/H+ or K+/H+ antiporter/mannitol/fructose-specific phosphotransferase system IIA component (Ntr-type)
MDTIILKLETLIVALTAGVSLLVIAQHLRIPAIVPLLIGGIVLGPELIGVIDPGVLGTGLNMLVAVCVAVILFEGGLTLEPEGFEKAPLVIWRLLTLGVLATWLGTTLLIVLLFDFTFSFALLASSLIIVTGPTVIHPLLRRIGVNERLHHILHWEGVLIDPIGVFIAVLCFEWFTAGAFTMEALESFGLRVLVGMGFGIVGGYLLTATLQRHWVPREYTNIFVLAWGMLFFVLSDVLVHEAGLLTVIVVGFVLGLNRSEEIKQLKQFKLELTEMAIAILFILLAAELRMDVFLEFLARNGLWLVLGVLVLIRPLGVLVSTFGSQLSVRERLFLSWMAPRGIVAGSMASLFTLRLQDSGHPEATFLQAFTFSIIGFTVIIQGLSAGKVAQLLNVKAEKRDGWLIVGAHLLSRRIANFIQKQTGTQCFLMDLNTEAARQAESEGLTVFRANALSQNALPPEYYPFVGNVIALTDNRDLNQLICERWAEVVGRDHVYRWTAESERQEHRIGGLGKPIWNNLPKPTQIEYAVRNREAVLVPANLAKLPARLRRDTIPLVLHHGGRLQMRVSELPTETEGSVLLFRRKANYLSFYTYPEQVLVLSPMDQTQLFTTMVENARERFPQLSLGPLVEELLQREKAYPTRLSHDVAVPHAHSAQLREPLCVVALIREGIPWDTEEGSSLIRLVFMVLSPHDDPEVHLNLLAEIARVAAEGPVVQELLARETPQAFLDYLQQIREQLTL